MLSDGWNNYLACLEHTSGTTINNSHKAHVIDLLKRVCAVSVRTVGVVRGMERTER